MGGFFSYFFPSQEPSTDFVFGDIQDSLKTGDLVTLYRGDSDVPNYGMIINNSENEEFFPILLATGVTKPPKEFNKKRNLTTFTATVRIFYGDLKRATVSRLKHDKPISATAALDLIDDIDKEPYNKDELKILEDAETPHIRNIKATILDLGYLYKKLGVICESAKDIFDKWPTILPVEDPIFIKVPPPQKGPMKGDEPPLMNKILRGSIVPRHTPVKKYSQIKDTLNTGDIVLFCGVDAIGWSIKMFTTSEYSHIGMVLRPKATKVLMLWESQTNPTSIVDVTTGKINKGVEIVPLQKMILSGFYDQVAIRRLVDITDEQREKVHKKMMELTQTLEGIQYEKSMFDLAQMGFDFCEEYITFLKSEDEDISSLFCSELVAHAYQECGLLNEKKPSDEYTPDDFAEVNNLQLEYGKLSPEEYIEIKFED